LHLMECPLYYLIYKITNIINGKYYIGKHKTNQVDDGYMGSGKLIVAAIRKYGIDNFTKEILHYCISEEEMNAKETELVVVNEQTYNLCPGGHGGFGYINANITAEQKQIHKALAAYLKKYRSDDEFRQRIIQARRIRSSDPTFRAKLSQGVKLVNKERGHGNWLGKKHSETTKQQMAESHKGKHEGSKNSQFGSLWITNGIKNQKINKNDPIPEGWHPGRKMKPTSM
jgi:hypothetical protein